MAVGWAYGKLCPRESSQTKVLFPLAITAAVALYFWLGDKPPSAPQAAVAGSPAKLPPFSLLMSDVGRGLGFGIDESDR